MKSFPSTLNNGGSNIVPGVGSSKSLVDTIVSQFTSAFTNAWKSSVNATKSGMRTTGTVPDTSNIPYSVEQDIQALYLNHTTDTNNAIPSGHNFSTLGSGIQPEQHAWNNYLENPFKFDRSALHILNTYKYALSEELDAMSSSHGEEVQGYIKNEDGEQEPIYEHLGTSSKAVPSLFNPYFGVNVYGLTQNTPLLDTQKSKVLQNNHMGFTDCSIKKLISISNDPTDTELGNAKYKYADFMYCKDLGMPNNRLITLRKFSAPVGDNIFYGSVIGVETQMDPDETPSDIGRMVCYFDTDDNKLEDIMSYEYDATWKELNSNINQQDSKEEDRSSPLGKIVNTFSPSYQQGIQNSTANGSNSLFGWMGSKVGLKNSSAWYKGHEMLRNYDKNKIYTPKNTLQSMHIYEGKLEFKHEFTLTFSYKMRSYDNINQKSAFLDLLGNILNVTYTRGSFWGGRNEILGPKPNTSGWKKANAIKNNAYNGIGGFLESLGSCVGSGDLLGNLMGALSSAFTGLGKMVSNVFSSAKEAITSGKALEAGKTAVSITAKTMRGIVDNQLGRPQVYCFDSLLSGDNTGLWHVTIGNPRNPIAAFGNLILKNAKITHSGPLGIDDFPTEIKCVVTLAHARPRDKVAIEKMYTKGHSSLHIPIPPTSSMIENMTESAKNGATIMQYQDIDTNAGTVTMRMKAEGSANLLNYYGTYDSRVLQRNCEELY